jgi:hypothetical protein
MMQLLKYLIIGIPFAALFVVLVILAFGPVIDEIRQWLKKGHF